MLTNEEFETLMDIVYDAYMAESLEDGNLRTIYNKLVKTKARMTAQHDVSLMPTMVGRATSPDWSEDIAF